MISFVEDFEALNLIFEGDDPVKKYKLSKNVIGNIISYMDSRKNGDIKVAKDLKSKLEKSLGKNFKPVLTYFGDPDVNKKEFWKIRDEWFAIFDKM